jgi:hypothetical protein
MEDIRLAAFTELDELLHLPRDRQDLVANKVTLDCDCMPGLEDGDNMCDEEESI